MMPKTLIRRADRKLFSINSRHTNNIWRDILEEIILIFSDQQLVTGLGILISGFVQAFLRGLDLYHWNFVINLSWLSSTIHLASLSLLRDRLNRNSSMRTIRLCLMATIFGLLIAAISPTLSPVWEYYPMVPLYCVWPAKTYDGIFWGRDMVIADTVVTYLNITILFPWKLAQFFETSHSWLRLWGRAKLECTLESAAKRVLQTQPSWWSKLKYRLIVHVYVPLVVYMDILESFMATNLALAFTLTSGTFRLLGPLIRNGLASGLETELEMGFGQILPLLLSLQAGMVIIGGFSGKSNGY